MAGASNTPTRSGKKVSVILNVFATGLATVISWVRRMTLRRPITTSFVKPE